VKNVIASAGRRIEARGRNVKAEAGLSRTIMRNGWFMARSMLEYKAALHAVKVVAVQPAYTNQECSACGHTAAENRKTLAAFVCVTCGHRENADRSTAKNILRRAQRQIAQFICANGIRLGGNPASTRGARGN
jgi:putative transposase